LNTRQTLLKHVTINRLKDYLARKEWAKVPFGREEVQKFTHRCGSECYEVFVPSRSDLVDYNRVVEIAIWTISAIEDRSFDTVLEDILPCVLVELVEIRSLIGDCECLIGKHRDEFALRQSLESLRSRERSLEIEYALVDTDSETVDEHYRKVER